MDHVPLFDFECLSNNVGYWEIWPGHTCKKETIKQLKNIIGELLRWNQNGVLYFIFVSLKRTVTVPHLFLQKSIVF